jgi:hypothetical protein
MLAEVTRDKRFPQRTTNEVEHEVRIPTNVHTSTVELRIEELCVEGLRLALKGTLDIALLYAERRICFPTRAGRAGAGVESSIEYIRQALERTLVAANE